MSKVKWLLFAVLFLAAVLPAYGNTNQTQWEIVATTESAPNASPIQYDLNGDAINCTGQNPDSASAWDSGHVGPKGDCYNPLTITFDLYMPITASWGPIQANVLRDADNINLNSLTNSVGSNDGSVESITVSLNNCVYTIVVTNEDGSKFTFTGTSRPDPILGTFTSIGGSSGKDSGKVLIYNDTIVPSGVYSGTFEHGASDKISINMGSQPALDFALNAVTVNPEGTGNQCFKKAMSTTDPLAASYGPNYVSGDVNVFTVGDGQGNAITLILTPDMSSTGVFTNPDSPLEYVTFYVNASTNSACPAGLNGYDNPFTRVINMHSRAPVVSAPHAGKVF